MVNSTAIRESAIARVRAGESIQDVALRYNIPSGTLTRWVHGYAGTSSSAEPGPASSRSGEVTILDVAERANLSKSVVSRALRGQYGVSSDARKKVEQAADELGFVLNAAAQNLSARRTNTLGVLVRDASSAFYGEMQSALQRRGTQVQNRVFITSGVLDNNDEVRALRDLIALRVDGLVVCSARLPAEEITRFSGRFPLVVAGRIEQNAELNSVYGDEETGVQLLAEHLVNLGHDNIAVLQTAEQLSPTLYRRAANMKKALTALGAHPTIVEVGDSASVSTLTQQLPSGISAAMCPNDRYAANVIHGMPARDTLSVTGFDGVGGLAHELLGISTWRQPIDAIGTAAIDLLMTYIAQPDRPREHVILPGELRVSRSTRPAR